MLLTYICKQVLDVLAQLPERDSLAAAIEFEALKTEEVTLLSRLIPQVLLLSGAADLLAGPDSSSSVALWQT